MDVLSGDFQSFYDMAFSPCAVLDKNLHYVEVNKSYCKVLERTRDQLIGNYIWDVFPGAEEYQTLLNKIFAKALDGNAASLTEIPYSINTLGNEGEEPRKAWWTVHATPIPKSENNSPLIGMCVEDVTERILARELKDAISGELQHRVGNLLSIILTIARQTAKTATDLESFIDGFVARVEALARTHRTLSGRNWDGATLKTLAELELEAFTKEHGHKIIFDGPDLKLTTREAQALSMALHELTTNAAKHGALKEATGRLQISWKTALPNGYEFEWRESDLKDVHNSDKLGFGTMMLTRILPSQLDGEATRIFEENSFIYRLKVPIRKDWVG